MAIPIRNGIILALIGGLALAGGCGGDDPAGPAPADPTAYRLVLPDSFSVCRDATYRLTAVLEPHPQAPDTTVLYSWLCDGRAGRLYLSYYTQYHAWTSEEPIADYQAEGLAQLDTVFCEAALVAGDAAPVTVARDTVLVRVGQPSIRHEGELHGELAWEDEGTRFVWSVYVIYPLEPGYGRHMYGGEGFTDPLYWGDGFEYIGPPFLYGSLVSEDEVWVLLTGGSGPVDPDHPEAPQATLDAGLARFDGGVFTIRPLCDP